MLCSSTSIPGTFASEPRPKLDRLTQRLVARLMAEFHMFLRVCWADWSTATSRCLHPLLPPKCQAIYCRPLPETSSLRGQLHALSPPPRAEQTLIYLSSCYVSHQISDARVCSQVQWEQEGPS